MFEDVNEEYFEEEGSWPIDAIKDLLNTMKKQVNHHFDKKDSDELTKELIQTGGVIRLNFDYLRVNGPDFKRARYFW